MNRKQVKEQAARYAKFVEWSDEDRCFIGRCPGLFAGGVHGSDEARVYRNCARQWKNGLSCSQGRSAVAGAAGGQDVHGRFVLRVEPALHRRLAARALAAGESLNTSLAPGPSVRRKGCSSALLASLP